MRSPGVAFLAGLGLGAAAVSALRGLVGRWARRAVVQKRITVRAPVAEVFAFWSRWENFPRFMGHVRDVRPTEAGTSRWTAAGPGGTKIQWDTVLSRYVRDRIIAWRTVSGSLVGHAGPVHVQPAPEGGTRLRVRLAYQPPAAALPRALVALLGQDPERAIDEDLMRLKTLLEAGRLHAR